MNIPLPKKSHILGYSCLVGVLFSVMPFTVTMDHIDDHIFWPMMQSFVILLMLVISIFYCSFYINMRIYKEKLIRIFWMNILAFLVLNAMSICIHYPFWISSQSDAIPYFVRDEVVRNIILFATSYLAAKYYMKNKENQQIQIALANLEKENLANQVRGLTQQLNPHFFFNALNTLSGIVHESPEKSELFIDKLSQVFRYVLKLQDYETMNLEDELRFMDDYLYLLKIRFEDMMQIHIENHAEGVCKVVPLCTQLLLENVIKHNKISRQAPMKIDIVIDGEYLMVCNTYLPKVTLNSNKMGLQNLNKRCQLYAGKPIVVEQTDETFCVKVPLIRN